MLFAAATVILLSLAWLRRSDGYLHADHGAGYWLGIAGTVVMLALFTYPLRKRFPSLASLGSVGTWFRLHMILGIIGPSMIVLHSNFKLGPINSKLALLSMLTVVASGLVGRYLHGRAHRGFYGQQAELNTLMFDIAAMAEEIRQHISRSGAAALVLQELSSENMTPRSLKRVRARVRHDLERAEWINPVTGQALHAQQRKQAIQQVDDELKALSVTIAKANRLRFYERLFGVWHHLHTPLLVLLFLTVILHIIAVELY